MRERERKREKERRPQPPVGPSVASLCHPWLTTTNLSYRFPIFETSATALCGTTGTHTSYNVGRQTIAKFLNISPIMFFGTYEVLYHSVRFVHQHSYHV